MHVIIPFMFDYWANLVVHLLLLKSSMVNLIYSRCESYLTLPEANKGRG